MSRFAKFVVVLACLATFIGIFNAIPQVAHASSRTYSSLIASSSATSPLALPADRYVVQDDFVDTNFGSIIVIRRGYQGATEGTGFGVRHIESEHPPYDKVAMDYVLHYGHVAGEQSDGSLIIECYYGTVDYRLILSFQDTSDGLGLGVVTMFPIG